MLLPVHDIHGRLRFTLAAIRGDRRRTASLRARVRAIEGVSNATANPLTGSLIVQYDGARRTRERILASLDGGPSALPEPAAMVIPCAGTLAEILAKAVAERMVEHAIRIALAAVI